VRKIDPLSKAIGARLREVRESKRISQDDLARRSGLHRTFIGRAERGETNITMRTLYAFAAGLEILIPQLLDEDFHRKTAKHTDRKKAPATPPRRL
jgi:transcriptional regulator with XRE-family HTH domain